MKLRKKTKKKLRKKLGDEQPTLVVCTGKKCAPREASLAVLDEARRYAAGRVRVVAFGCLGVCEKGPIAARLPAMKAKKRIDGERVHAIVDKLLR